MKESSEHSFIPFSKPIQQVVWLLLMVGVVYGIYQAVSFAWVGDDAFISFRYAKNLVDGHGLVFNVGEKVEGYTNFLWTILIAAGMLLGFEPILFSHVLSISFYLFTALLFAYLSYRLHQGSNRSSSFVLPITALALLVHHDFHVYATSGLETAMTTALVSLGFAVLVFGQLRRTFLMAGVVLILAALSRPDAMLFYVVGLPYLFLITKRPRFRTILSYLIPLIVIYLPYWIIRYNYYGYPFPNTYYAKSASLAYWAQGWSYVWLYLKTYYVLLVLPIVLMIIGLRQWRQIRTKRDSMQPIERVELLSILFIIPYIVYVVRTGGDFMFARFLIPVTPICFFLMETYLMSLRARALAKISIAVLIVAGVAFRWNPFVPDSKVINGITNEPAYYSSEMIRTARTDGEKLKKYLGNLDVTVGYYGTKAMLMYYSELPLAIECETGLTDEYLAHQPLSERGRPGHEKSAPYEYLRQRRTNFIFELFLPDRSPYDRLRTMYFGNLPSYIVTYDQRIMDSLKAYPEIRFVDFPEFLDRYVEKIDSVSPERLRTDIRFFKHYYFEKNADPERLAALEEQAH